MEFFSKINPKLVDTETLKMYKPKSINVETINNKLNSFNDQMSNNIITFLKNHLLTIILMLLLITFLTYRYFYTLTVKDDRKKTNNQLIKIYQQQLADQEYQYQKNRQKLNSINNKMQQIKNYNPVDELNQYHNFF